MKSTPKFWTVPRMWEGQTVAILASGESMSQDVADAVRRSGVRSIVVNNTVELAPWADILYAADARWWQVHKAEALAFKGLKVGCEYAPGLDVLILKNTGVVGFDPDPSCIRTGGNGGYQAMHVAVHAGAKRILLCGFDMRGKHWHPEHKDPLRNSEEAQFIRWIERMGELAIELQERGIEVWNCTPGSALKCFPFVPLEGALATEPVGLFLCQPKFMISSPCLGGWLGPDGPIT